jgi:hypothetical protein
MKKFHLVPLDFAPRGSAGFFVLERDGNAFVDTDK